jgi:gas vesicle protein GvpL/GvpF
VPEIRTVAILPYCVVLARLKLKKPQLGVDGEKVSALNVETLCALYSEFDDSALAPDSLRQSALEFHRVLASVFRQVALVPFRFPNLLKTGDELEAHLRANLQKYQSFLERTRDAVQMEIVLPNPVPIPVPAETKTSGSEYLRKKHQKSQAVTKLANAILEKIKDLALDTRSTGARVYLLVPRARIDELRAQLKDFDEVRISGPWPAAEFLEETRQAPGS